MIVSHSESVPASPSKHQENSLRTALLVSADGCLRRARVAPLVTLREAAEFRPVTLADLLR